jgi:GntR family transcriptional regulator
MLHSLSPQFTVPERAAEDLRAAIMGGTLARDGRLPPEDELARRLSVSRASLRQAVAILEQAGLVIRRQGQGTIVVDRIRQLENNLSDNFGVTELIESVGRKPGVRGLVVTTKTADPTTDHFLALPPRSRVAIIQRIRTADHYPLVYTVDVLPLRLLAEHGLGAADLRRALEIEQSLYRLLKKLGVVVHHGIAAIQPVALENQVAGVLGFEHGALALLLDQVDYSADGEPVMLSHEYYPKDVLTVHVYRKGPSLRL